mgnify:CR=1 FL=1
MVLSRGMVNFSFYSQFSILIWWLMFGYDLVVVMSNFELENVSFACLQRISACVAKIPALGFLFWAPTWLYLKGIVTLIEGVW